MELLELIQDLFGLALGRIIRARELKLMRAAAGVNAAESLDDALEILAETCCFVADVAGTTVALWDEAFTSATIRAGAGTSLTLVGETIAAADNVSYCATQTARPVVPRIRGEEGLSERLARTSADRACVLSVPLLVNGAPRITFQIEWNTLQTVIETVPDGVIVSHHSEVSLNAAARRLLRLSPDDARPKLGELVIRRLDGTVADASDYPSRLCRATGREQSARLLVELGGENRIIDFKAAPMSGGFVELIRDVTDEHGEQTVTAHFLESLFDSLPVAAGVSDAVTGEVINVNRAFEQLLGFSGEELVGTRHPYPWWRAAESPFRWDAPAGPVNSVYRRKDGKPVPVELLPFLVRGADGAPARVVVLVSDLSERREFERQLVQSGKLAAIGELASGVAHEINNPLFAILGLVEFLLRDAEPGTKAHERLSRAGSARAPLRRPRPRRDRPAARNRHRDRPHAPAQGMRQARRGLAHAGRRERAAPWPDRLEGH